MFYPHRSVPQLRSSGRASTATKNSRRRRKSWQIEPLEHRRLLAAYDITIATGMQSQNVPNGAGSGTGIFERFNPGTSSGTGLINAFFSVDNNGTEQGYNTDAPVGNQATDPVLQDAGSDTTSLKLADIPKVVFNGITYREFALDANQNKGGTSSLLSLDTFEIYQTNIPNLGDINGQNGSAEPGYPFPAAAATKIYDIGAGNYILLNTEDAGSGSGRFDMDVLVPNSLFAAGQTFVTMYTKFGVHNASNDGFEEWAVGQNQSPITGTIEGFKFNDLNHDGIYEPQSSETTIAGVTVNLYSVVNGVVGSTPLQTTTTDANGLYTFQNINPEATYTVRENITLPPLGAGWTQTTPNTDNIFVNPGDVWLPMDDPRFASVPTSVRHADETLAIGNVHTSSPAISTTAGGTIVVGSGSKLTDTAALSGGFNPTGTVTFTLTNSSNVVVYTDVVTVSGNGTYTTASGNNPGGYLPVATGTYLWSATYSGDSNNNGATDNGVNENETVGPAGPAISTTAGGTIVVGSGSKLTDTAALSGGFNPTGTVTFTLTNSSNVVVYTDVVTVSGNGTYTTASGNNPGGYLPVATGTYLWSATYSGDSNNNGATDNGVNENETVGPAGPAISTTAGGTIVVGSGSKLTDTAALSGGFNPTGTVTFKLTNSSNVVVYTDVVTVSGNGTYTTASGNNPGGYLPVATGTYLWSATYSGDSNNNGATDNGVNENETVGPAGPAISTTAGGTIVVGSGSKLTDTAALSGGFNPTGTVTFTLTNSSNVVVYTDVVTVSGNGTYTTASGNNPGGYLPVATGTYLWSATYSGDSNNNGATDNGVNENETVGPAGPAISTTAGGTIVVGSGSKLTDTAALSGGFNPTGTVTFTLTNSSNVVVYTDVVTVSGNGTYTTASGNNPGGYLPVATGTYLWSATYSGDSNNNGATDNGVNENETVGPAGPAISTTAGGTIVVGSGSKLTDTAALSGGFNPTGTVTFKLTNSSNVVVYTDVVTVSGNGTYTTASGNNPGGYLPVATGTYLWSATYSGDSNNNGATDNGVNENETVGPAGPAISTTAGGTIVVGSGSKLTDTAALSGGFNPTGTVTFTLTNSSNVVVYTDVVTVSGNGTYTTASGNNPGGYLPVATGTYLWSATYSGDSNNNGATDNGVNENETVGPAGPAISTTAGGTIVVGSGSKLTDTAALSGGFNPTGTVTFTLTNSSNVVVYTDVVTVSGNGTYTTASGNNPGGYLPVATGTYLWSATYSGDSNNNGATDNGVNENETVGPAGPAISTTAGGTIVVGSGSKLTDTAALSGGFNPTGTVTFKLTNSSNVVVYTDVVTVSGNGTYTTASGNNPGGYLPVATGTYLWSATYSGDSNNNGATDNGVNENETVGPAGPAISTTAGGTIVVGSGSKLTDTAALSGGFNPTGTVTFTLTNSSNVVVYTDVVTVSGNGTYTTASGNNPGGYLPVATGTYLWSATYSGDSNNNGATDNGVNENETVGPAGPAISTTAGGTIVVGSGSKLTDTAALSGGFNPTGTVTFTLTNSSNVVVYTDVVTVSGNGTYTTASGNNPGGYLPVATGTYLWSATYSGDSNNNGATDNGVNENETVGPAGPAISTTAGGTIVVGSGSKLTDTAALSGGFNPTGTVTFTLTNSSNVVVYTDVVTVSGNGTYTTASGNNPGGYLPVATGTYLWSATYSGDSNNNGATDNGVNENETVGPAGPAISTTAGGTIVVGSGSKLTDTAALSGGFNPTGTVTFTLTNSSNVVVYTDVVTVSGNGTYTTASGNNPGGYLPVATGTYLWSATYSGDSNNNGATDNGVNENETVGPAGPAISTTANPMNVTLDTSTVTLKDSATLSGGYHETGTITFTLHSPSNVVVDTETVLVSGNGQYTTPTGYTLPISSTVTGTYEWVASYSGDSNNNGASSEFGDEPVTVNPANPSISTVPGSTVVIGSGARLTDNATLSGGYHETGTITFTLYNPSNVVVDTETVLVSGNGQYTTPTGYLPTDAGAYEWVASYSGDFNNNSVTSPFGEEPESVINPQFIVISSDAGSQRGDPVQAPQVQLLDQKTGMIFDVKDLTDSAAAPWNDGEFHPGFNPYDSSYQAGVRVALADVTGDGIPEIIVAPGRLYTAEGIDFENEVRIYSVTPVLDQMDPTHVEFEVQRIGQFSAYSGTTITTGTTLPPDQVDGGVQLAVGDVNGDGRNDIVTVPTRGPIEVKVFTHVADPTQAAFTLYGDYKPADYKPKSFLGGGVVAVANLGTFNGSTRTSKHSDPTGKSEVIVGNGSGLQSTIEIFNVNAGKLVNGVLTNWKRVDSSFALTHPFAAKFRGGVFIDTGDVTGDGIPDLVVGAGNGGNSAVNVYNGCSGKLITKLNAGGNTYNQTTNVGGDLTPEFSDQQGSQQAPVRVAFLHVDVDGEDEIQIVTVQGTDGKSHHIKFWDPLSGVEFLNEGLLEDATTNFFGSNFEEFVAVSGVSSQRPVELSRPA